jgi:hypothetical protein
MTENLTFSYLKNENYFNFFYIFETDFNIIIQTLFVNRNEPKKTVFVFRWKTFAKTSEKNHCGFDRKEGAHQEKSEPVNGKIC